MNVKIIIVIVILLVEIVSPHAERNHINNAAIKHESKRRNVTMFFLERNIAAQILNSHEKWVSTEPHILFLYVLQFSSLMFLYFPEGTETRNK